MEFLYYTQLDNNENTHSNVLHYQNYHWAKYSVCVLVQQNSKKNYCFFFQTVFMVEHLLHCILVNFIARRIELI